MAVWSKIEAPTKGQKKYRAMQLKKAIKKLVLSSKPASFLHLPGEIRNQIYGLYKPADNSDYAWNDILSIANSCQEVRQDIISFHARRVKHFTTSLANLVKFVGTYQANESVLLNALAKTGSTLIIECGQTWTHDMDILPTLMTLRKFPKLRVELNWAWADVRDLSGVIKFFNTARSNLAWSPENLKALKVSQVILHKEHCWHCLGNHGGQDRVWALWHPRIMVEGFVGSEEDFWGQEEQIAQLLKSLDLCFEEERGHFQVDVKLTEW